MGLAGIITTLIVAGIVWLVQEIRMKRALQQQRKDLRADFREDLKNIIPLLLETWLKGQKPKQEITPKIKAEFAGIAETSSTAWYGGEDIKALFAGQEFHFEDLQEPHANDKDDGDNISFVP